MSRNNNNYKEHQDRYEELHEDWVKYSNNWSDDEKRNHLENMKISNDEYVCQSILPSRTLAQPILISYHLLRHIPDTQGAKHKSRGLIVATPENCGDEKKPLKSGATTAMRGTRTVSTK